MTFTVTHPVRYRDLDPRRHVNHAVYVTYFEEAKSAFFSAVLGIPLDEAPTVVRALDVEFERPIELGQTVRIDLTVARVGETSLGLEYAVYADDERAATGATTSVVMDFDAGEPARVPDAWRRALREHAGE